MGILDYAVPKKHDNKNADEHNLCYSRIYYHLDRRTTVDKKAKIQQVCNRYNNYCNDLL